MPSFTDMVEVEIEVSLKDIFDEIENDELIAEMKKRRLLNVINDGDGPLMPEKPSIDEVYRHELLVRIYRTKTTQWIEELCQQHNI